MTLIVTTFHVGENGELVDDPFPSNSEEMFGPESWRTQVWGSQWVRARGLQLLPTLAEADLHVSADELPALASECSTLLDDLSAFAQAVNRDQRSLESRLQNRPRPSSELKSVAAVESV